MAAFLLAAGMGALSLAGSAASARGENKKLEADARAVGVQHAGIDFGAERRGEFIMARLSGIQEARVQNYVEVTKSQQQAEADARVSAAAAGVSGTSTEAVINDTQRTAAQAKQSIEKQAAAMRLQIKTDYVDNYVNAAASKGSVEMRGVDKKGRAMNAALGFASAAIGGWASGR